MVFHVGMVYYIASLSLAYMSNTFYDLWISSSNSIAVNTGPSFFSTFVRLREMNSVCIGLGDPSIGFVAESYDFHSG